MYHGQALSKRISDVAEHFWELLDFDFSDGLASGIPERIKALSGTGGRYAGYFPNFIAFVTIIVI